MEELYDKYKQDKRLISQLNRCRMKIQAITLADITDASGRYLMIEQLKGNRPQERNSKVEWPTVGNIRKKYWKEWKNCVRETFCIRGTNKLKKKLGKWIRTTSQEWDTYIFRSTHNLIWRRTEVGQENGMTMENQRKEL